MLGLMEALAFCDLGQCLVGVVGSVVGIELAVMVLVLMLLSVSHCSVTGGVLGERGACSRGGGGPRRGP